MTSFAPSASRAWKLAGPATRRCFSTSKSLQTTYGFIGLGRMGMSQSERARPLVAWLTVSRRISHVHESQGKDS